MDNRLFDTYKNSVIPHGHHIYATAAEMAMVTMCAYPPSQHALTHWKCVLRCCANCPHIDLPDQEPYRHHYNTSPSVSFRIYNLITRCIVYRRRPIDEDKFSFLFTISFYCVTQKIIHQKRDCYYGDIYC